MIEGKCFYYESENVEYPLIIIPVSTLTNGLGSFKSHFFFFFNKKRNFYFYTMGRENVLTLMLVTVRKCNLLCRSSPRVSFYTNRLIHIQTSAHGSVAHSMSPGLQMLTLKMTLCHVHQLHLCVLDIKGCLKCLSIP